MRLELNAGHGVPPTSDLLFPATVLSYGRFNIFFQGK